MSSRIGNVVTCSELEAAVTTDPSAALSPDTAAVGAPAAALSGATGFDFEQALSAPSS
jgi:hypothetical protein